MRESIGRRLFIIFTGLAALPLLLAGTVLGLQNLFIMQRQALAVQQQVAGGVSLRVHSILQETEKNLQTISQAVGLPDKPLDEQRDILWGILLGERNLVEFSLLDANGQEQVRLSSIRVFGPGGLRDLSESDEFRTPLVSRETYYSPVWFDEDLNEPVMTVALPLFDVYGEEISEVLVAIVRFKPVWDLLASLPVGEEEEIFLVDSEGGVIAHRNPSVVLQGARFIVPGNDGIVPGLSGELSFLAARPIQIGQQRLVVLASVPVRAVMGPVIRVMGVGFLIVIVIAVGAIFLWNRAMDSIVVPIRRMAEVAQAVSDGDLTARVEVTNQDEIGVLAESLNRMTAQLRELIGSLEQRVADRTKGLQAAADVARATTSVLDPDELMRQVVNLVQERFDLYYVGLFLLDEERRFAVLRAGTGEAGRKMLEQGHRLEVGGDSMIGQCIALAEARVAMDVSEEDRHFENPLLPDTHSELALPLRSRGHIIGAMTVQSTALAAFDETDIAALQTMADLVAVAIDNARLFVETQETLQEMESIQRRYLGQAWAEYVQEREISGYRNIGGEIVPLTGAVLMETGGVVDEGRPTEAGDEEGATSELVVPIKMRDLTIGVLGFRGYRRWDDEDVALAESLAEQLALAADNLRLLDETQRSAARERLTREITARMRETLDVDYVLRTAVRGIREALGLVEAEAWMDVPVEEEDGGPESEG